MEGLLEVYEKQYLFYGKQLVCLYVLFGYLRRTNILIVLWGQEINLLTEEQKKQKFFYQRDYTDYMDF